MKYVYVVMEYDDIIFITSNFNTAVMYWYRERTQMYGKRPDIFKWELGKRGKYEYITDEEAQTYVNKIFDNRN